MGRHLWYTVGEVPSRHALDSLDRIPWEGGPSYYSAFEDAVASGMTDQSFFPLLVDFESVASQSDIDTDKGYGVNGYYRLTSDSDLSLIRSNGMIAFPGPGHSGAGTETVGWNIDDEVDMWGGPGWNAWNGSWPGQDPGPNSDCGYDVMAQLTAADGPQGPSVADGRIRHMNYGKGVVFWESTEEAAVFTNGGANPSDSTISFALDAVSADLYFYSDNNTITEAPSFLGIPSGEVRRAANYGLYVIDRIRSLQQSANIYQPVYGFVETASQGANVPQADLTDDKIRGAVWSCLIHEARGIIYFVHDFVYSGSDHCLRDNVGGHTAAVTALNAQITNLAPVLNTQSYTWVANSTVDSMLKQYDGNVYLFAMSVRQGTHDTGPRVLTLPAGVAGTIATVIGEDRTLTVVDGQFTDSFAAEYTCHIYRIEV